MRKNAQKIIVWLALAALLLPYLAFAADPKPIPLDLKVEILSQNKVESLAQYIGLVYQYATGIASILAVAMIMWGGMKWIFAGGDSGKIGKAHDTIINAIMGLVLALGSFVLLNTVNPALVDLKMPALTEINPISMLTTDFCPASVVTNKYCGEIATIPEGKCISVRCASAGAVCSQRMSTNSSEITKLSCIYVSACGNKCEDIDTQQFCEQYACWQKHSTTCYWEGGSCKKGKGFRQECEEDFECQSRICNKGFNVTTDGVGDNCAKVGGEDVGVPCDRDLDCGCFNVAAAGDPKVCPRVCDLSEAEDKCVAVASKPNGEGCSHDNQCQSGNCNGLENVAGSALGGAMVGAIIGAVDACIAWGAAGGGLGLVAGGVGAVPGAALGCLGGALFGGGIGGVTGAVVGGGIAGGTAYYLTDKYIVDGNCSGL